MLSYLCFQTPKRTDFFLQAKNIEEAKTDEKNVNCWEGI